jgi:acetyl esterase/lipase
LSLTWKLPPARKPTLTAGADLLALKEQMRAGEPPFASDPTVAVRDVDLSGVPCVVCEPPQPRSVSVYFHGGGYRLGSARWSTPFASRLAAFSRSTVVVVDYRLAPEHPFPAGIHDASAVYGELLDRSPDPIVAVGDSAGGGLAAALVVAAAMADIPPPAGLVLMSPWLDLTCTAATFETRAQTDQLFSLESARQAADLYLQGHDPTDPLVSPARARLAAWPPALVLASTEEVLLQDSLGFVSALALSGSRVAGVFEPDRSHAWPAVFPDQPEAARALEVIGAFYAGLTPGQVRGRDPAGGGPW